MSEFATPTDEPADQAGLRRLFPMKIGDAVVYVEQTSTALEVESDEFYPVSAPDPSKAFQIASEAIRECVRIVGERIAQLAGDAKPAEISVEFSVGFEAKGRASFIPILVQAEASANTALKVSAVWRLGAGAAKQ